MSSGLKLLVVDDEYLIRETTADMARDLGYAVLDAGTAEEALKLIAEERPDCLVTDIQLPEMSGLDLAVEAAKLRADIFVVFATGQDRPAIPSGVRGAFLPKPYTFDMLRTALEPADSKA